MARRRQLRPEEQELWQAVARTARPLQPNAHKGASREDAPLSPSSSHPIKPEDSAAAPRFSTFRLGEKAKHTTKHALAPGLSQSLTTAPLQMDAKAYGKMTRGKLVPEARIDLHGLTLGEAHPDLIRFILNASSQGMRLVLVITGKGKIKDDWGPIPQRMGALRHAVPQWLRLPPLGHVVLQVAEAHLRHGGSGAYYVYLRRGR